MVTLKRIKELLTIDYSKPTGLIWKINNNHGMSGKTAGFICKTSNVALCYVTKPNGKKFDILTTSSLVYALKYNVEINEVPHNLLKGTKYYKNPYDLEKGYGGYNKVKISKNKKKGSYR